MVKRKMNGVEKLHQASYRKQELVDCLVTIVPRVVVSGES